jgi:hypothetical protein
MQLDRTLLDPSGILRRLVVARHTAEPRPAGDTASVLVNKGGKKGLLQYAQTPAEYRALHTDSVQSFASYIMTSMHLAGLDRRYGSLPSELSKLQRALDPDSPNSILDYSIMRRMEDTDMSLLQLELDSAARPAVLAAEVARVSEAVAMSFLMGKEHVGGGGFEYLAGTTEPSEMLQKLVGRARRLVTPSLHAYLTLTLFDPYAYGVSSPRAIMTFIASVLIRQSLRAQHLGADEAEWPLTTLDEDLMQRDQIAAAATEGERVLSDEEVKALRQQVEQMPAFRSFAKCMRSHSASTAHETNPAFHALYTVLKATYLMHFAATWLSARITEQLSHEGLSPWIPANPAANKYFLSKTDQSVLQSTEMELRGLCERYGMAAAKSEDLQIGLAADVLIYVLRASEIITNIEASARTGQSDAFRPAKLFAGDAPLPNAAAAAAALAAVADNGASTLLQIEAALQAHGGSIRHTSIPLMSEDDLTERSITRADAVVAIEDNEYTRDHIVYAARALQLYARYLLTAHESGQLNPAAHQAQLKAAYFARPEVLRLYRLRPALLFVGRLHSFLRRFYSGTGDTKAVPTIVTMLRQSGWSGSGGTKRTPQRTLDRAFESLTLVMSNALVYSHTGMSDAARGVRLVHHLGKLLNRNLQLMSLLQQHALGKVPQCHAFIHASKTQFTLPAAVAASLIPTTDVAPLDWSVGDLLYRQHDPATAAYDPANVRGLLRAVLGDRAFQRIENEQLPSIRLVESIARPLRAQGKHLYRASFERALVVKKDEALRIMQRLALANSQPT